MASDTYTTYLERELVNRMRREYVSPQYYKPPVDPQVLVAPPAPNNPLIVDACDEAMRLVREYKLQEDDEISRKQILRDLFVCCEILQQLGYKAVAGIGKEHFIYATRITNHD